MKNVKTLVFAAMFAIVWKEWEVCGSAMSVYFSCQETKFQLVESPKDVKLVAEAIKARPDVSDVKVYELLEIKP